MVVYGHPFCQAATGTLREQQHHEAEVAAKRIAALEGNVATLRGIIAKAEALAEQQRQDVATAAKRADNLVAELFEATANFSRCPSGSRAPATDEVRG